MHGYCGVFGPVLLQEICALDGMLLSDLFGDLAGMN